MSNTSPDLTDRILELLALLLGPPAVRRRGTVSPSRPESTARGRTTGRVPVVPPPTAGMSLTVRNFLAGATWSGNVVLPAPPEPRAAAIMDRQREVDLAAPVRTFFSVDWSGREVAKASPAAMATTPVQPPPTPAKSAPKAPVSLSTADVFGEFAFD